MPTLVRTKYDYDNHIHPGIQPAPKEKSLANQADMDAADINKIMARYEKTGVLIDPLGVERKPVFGDFSELSSYHESLSAARRAEYLFSLLPAGVRTRFNNDPQELIEFAGSNDKEKQKELVKLGLMTQTEFDALNPAEPEPPAAPSAPPATPPA